MSKDLTGGPAFPHGPLGDTMHGEDGREWHQYPAGAGMSLRDWLAGQALAGIMARPKQSPNCNGIDYDQIGEFLDAVNKRQAVDSVTEAFMVADAALAEREKGAQ